MPVIAEPEMVYWQGALDGLCGVYSVINACSFMFGRRLRKDDYRSLFRELGRTLEEQGRLGDVLASGMSVQTLGKLIDKASEFTSDLLREGIRRELAFRSDPPSLDLYWSKLAAHHRRTGEGQIIIGMSNSHDHWSCVRKVTDRSLLLADSVELRRLNRARCTISEPTDQQPHVLWPTQTYLLAVE